MMQDAPPLPHLHHITAIASQAQPTVDFYARLLGLDMVKRTVNFDDPTSYHLYFACRPDGRPGGLLTFFVWPHAPKGRWGLGTTHHVAFLVESAQAQDRWKRRLTDNGVGVTGPYDRRYFRSIYFTDPDGLILEIATAGPGFDAFGDPEGSPSEPFEPPVELTLGHRDEDAIAAHTWPEPVESIDDEMRLGSLHHVTCITGDDIETDRFYTDVLRMRRVRWTLNFDNPGVSHTYYANADADPGSTITFFGFTPKTMHPGRIGIGTVHHIAFATAGDESQAAWRGRLREANLNVTPVIDRKYFRSIYFSDPSGLLLEVATIPPGFAVDEPADALGGLLTLPDWLEPQRAEIESRLEPIR
jgi:glyoxalase family protein